MLSDPEKRKVYDQFGEEGLKGGFGGGGGGGAGFGGFHPRAAEEIFAEVRWAGLAEGCVMSVCANENGEEIEEIFALVRSGPG